MKLNGLIKATSLAVATLLYGGAQAATLTNLDGTNNFTGFDFDSNGTAFTTGFVPANGQMFGLTFFSWATTVKNNAANVFLPHLDNNADGVAAGPGTYEYTVVAKLNEQVSSCIGSSCTFNVLNGTYSIYYDTTPDANANAGSLGTGFQDGALLISGTFGPQAGGTFTVSGPGGQGNTVLQGLVSTTNMTYINPALTNTVVGTTLQLGSSTTNGYTSPGGFNGTAFAGGEIVFQADANQSFTSATTVPEPASIGLVAAALLAGGLATRRRSRK